MDSCIVYSLDYDETLHCNLPQAYIAFETVNGTLGYMERRATEETLRAQELFPSEESPELEVFEICDALQIEQITSRFIKSKKGSLLNAMASKELKKMILQFVNRKMNAFLTLVAEHDIPICHQIERKVKLEDIRIYPSRTVLEPRLLFEKSADGMRYTLFIRERDLQWYPSERNVVIVNNKPAWIIAKYHLFRLAHINGNKLKPFLKKHVLSIPKRMTHEYLEKFVKDIITKVNVKAIGFDINRLQPKPKAQIIAKKDFISESWFLNLVFDYDNTRFDFGDPNIEQTKLKYSGQSDVAFDILERDMALERKLYSGLERFGIEQNARKRLIPKTNDNDSMASLLWLAEHKADIESLGITVVEPKLDNQSINLNKPKLHLVQNEVNDWFDINGVITVGDDEISFRDLIDFVRENNRIVPLSDGSCFIIPIEWMTKYASIARWAKKKGTGVQILRSQHNLILDIDDDQNSSLRIYDQASDEIVFEPSSKLNATLRPYQRAGAQWLVSHQVSKLGCCLADDMGLGKTIQTLCALLHAKENISETESKTNTKTGQLTLFSQEHQERIQPLRALIIMPASLVFNWDAEIKKFASHLHVKKHMGASRSKKKADLEHFDIILTSYQTALRDVATLSDITWQYVVLDESQYIKNHNSKIFAAIQELPAVHKLSLSGTPIENSLSDLWAQMQFINPDILGTYPFFKKHFQLPIEKHQDEQMLHELKLLTQPYILRRTKEEVLKDLPEKTEQVIYCDMATKQKSLYEKEKSAARNMILQADMNDPQVKMQVFTTLLRLRQIANHPELYKKEDDYDSGKFEIICANIQKVRKSGQKALIFSSFVGHLDLVRQYLTKEKIGYATLTGQTPQRARQQAVNLFQEDEKLQFFLISIKAGGTGLNLTAADYVFILDPWWNPFIENQAIARAHRIGLDHPLTVLRYISKDSIEEKILKLQAKKKLMSDEILTQDRRSWSQDELTELLA